MGQRLFYPPSVAGWPGGMAWLGGQSVLARANFAAWITEPAATGRLAVKTHQAGPPAFRHRPPGRTRSQPCWSGPRFHQKAEASASASFQND